METTKDILEHYGIKGMRWGVRRTQEQLKNPTPVKITSKPGMPIVTRGGKRIPTHDEAKEAAIARQKAKSSGLQALSNKEIQTIVTRMNLEQQYAKLNPTTKSIGRRFVDSALEDAKGATRAVVPQLALVGAKNYFGDSEDYRVRVGLQVAEGLVNSRSERQNSKNKKKK